MALTSLLILISWAGRLPGQDGQTAAQLDMAHLEAIIAEHPSDGLAHYKLGLLYRESGDNRRATANLQSAISNGFDNLGARLNLMEAAFACGQSALGVETARKVATPSLKSTGVLLRVGTLLFNHLFYKDALHAFQLAQQASPDAFEPRFRVALTCYLLEDYAATVANLKSLEAVQSNPEAASLMASAEAELGHLATAVSILRTSIEVSPKSPHPYINLALIELDRGNSGEAEKVLDQFRTLEVKTDAKVFYKASRNACTDVAKALGRGEASVPSSKKGEFYYQLALQLQERFNYLSAVELIRVAQAEEGDSARVLLVAGTSCLNQDPLAADPVVFLTKALARDPSLHTAYYLLGRAFTRQGKLEEAAGAYRKAAELHPNPSYWVALGKSLGNQQAAIAEFKRALAIDPSYALAHLELGRVYVQVEEFEKARVELEKALELEPDFYEADYLLGRLFHRLGDEEQSRKQLQLFAGKKNTLMQQSAIEAGYIGDGR